MRYRKSVISLSSSSALAAVVITGAATAAFAQGVPLTIDPSAEAGPAPAPAPAYSAPAAGDGEVDVDAEMDDIYYGDYLDDKGDEIDDADLAPRSRNQGAVPPTHTVRSGDTLWDLSSYYFNDAWHWPKVWGLNPEISNPHWIYPGNIVRLREGNGAPLVNQDADPLQGDTGFSSIATKASQRPSGFQQVVYVDIDDLEDAATVVGSVHDKALLSTGDSIYVSYEEGALPKVGANFSIYSQGSKIKRDGETVGGYVDVHGELTITFAKEGKRARAVVTRALRPIERGMRVGPLELQFGHVQPVANSQEVDGEIVDLIGPDDLIGAQAVVIVDRGSDDGVQVGNRFFVLRRGDAYRKIMRPGRNVGQDDVDYPLRAIGEVIVVQAGKAVSLGLVTFSIHEFGVGDRVLMRKGQ